MNILIYNICNFTSCFLFKKIAAAGKFSGCCYVERSGDFAATFLSLARSGRFSQRRGKRCAQVRVSDPHPRVLDESRSREEVPSRFLAPLGLLSAARILAAVSDLISECLNSTRHRLKSILISSSRDRKISATINEMLKAINMY